MFSLLQVYSNQIKVYICSSKSESVSHLVMSDPLWPPGLQHPRRPCPSLSPGACSNSCPLSRQCHPTISSSVTPSPPSLSLSHHQGPFQWVSSSHQVAKVLELQHQSIQFSLVTQSCPTLCDPMDRSTPGLPVHHQLPELTQTHVHRVGDAIQPSHPLSFPSPPTFNLSQHQDLFKWVSSSHQVAKVLTFQL